MKADGLSRSDMVQGVSTEFDMPKDIAEAWVGRELSESKPNVMNLYKNLESARKSYLSPDYELQPGESEGVIIEWEQREFQSHGGMMPKKTSKPRILRTSTTQWSTFASRDKETGRPFYKSMGYSINKVLFRPAIVDPIQVDSWEEGIEGEWF